MPTHPLLAVGPRTLRIENHLHRVRDVTYDEECSTVRIGHGPQVMAALRDLAITALQLSGATNIAAPPRRGPATPSDS